MEIGMLWYDDDARRPLPEKVARAVAHYQTKYGAMPTVCFVNPSMLRDAPETAAGVQLRPARTIMINHFWVGIGEQAAAQRGARPEPAAARRNGRRAVPPTRRRKARAS